MYSNSAVCLFELCLYETSMAYASTAIVIDNSYPKSYFRKMNCLLELKMFHEIPKCLLNLYHKVDGKQMDQLNKKYTNFVENSRGAFDWIEIYKTNTGTRAK